MPTDDEVRPGGETPGDTDENRAERVRNDTADLDDLGQGVGTDGSLHAHHHRAGHPGVGTDGSLSSAHALDEDNNSDQ